MFNCVVERTFRGTLHIPRKMLGKAPDDKSLFALVYSEEDGKALLQALAESMGMEVRERIVRPATAASTPDAGRAELPAKRPHRDSVVSRIIAAMSEDYNRAWFASDLANVIDYPVAHVTSTLTASAMFTVAKRELNPATQRYAAQFKLTDEARARYNLPSPTPAAR